jgi:hypothetical protein
MRNKYAAVALTYGQRWLFWGLGAALLAAALGLWLAVPHHVVPARADSSRYVDERPVAFSVFLTVFAAVFGGAIASHLLEQLADWRAALTPGFRGPHLLVAGVAVLLVGIVLPVGASAWLRVSVPGLVALVLTTVLAIACAARWPWAAYAYVLAWFVTPRGFLEGLLFPQTWKAAVFSAAAIGLDAALLVLLAVRFAALRGDGPPHAAPFNGKLRALSTGDPASRYGAQPRNNWFERVARRRDRFTAPPRVIASASLVHRVNHWRLVTMGGWRPAALGIGMGLFGAALLASLIFLQGGKPGEDFPLAGALLFPPLIAPACVCGLLLPRRWFTLSDELLRPAARRRFILEMGLALACDLLSVWLWCTAACLLIAYTVFILGGYDATGPFRRGNTFLDTLPELAAGIGWSLASQLLAFGIIVTVLRWRSGILSLLALLPVSMCFVFPALLVWFMQKQIGLNYAPLLAAVATFATGAALTRRAYSRWRRTEIA